MKDDHEDRVYVILSTAQELSQKYSVKLEAVLLATLCSQIGVLLGVLTKGKEL